MVDMIEDPFDRLNRLEEHLVKLSYIMEYQKEQIQYLLAQSDAQSNTVNTHNKLLDIQNLRISLLEKEQKDGTTKSSPTKENR